MVIGKWINVGAGRDPSILTSQTSLAIFTEEMSFFNQGVAMEEKVVVQRASRPFLAALLAESSAETKPRRPRHHVRSHGLERPNLIKQKQQDIAARRLAEAAKIATKKNITL